jgi:NitT/TauT family transport system substrate-binding protein
MEGETCMIGRRAFIKGIGSTGLSSTLFIGDVLAQPALPLVKGVHSAPGLTFAAIFLANRLGLWAKNGITTELKQTQGGPLSLVALTNREANFAGVSNPDPVIAWGKGIKTLSVAALTGSLPIQFTAHKGWMSRVGLSASSPLADKLKAFKGARIGASTIGGAPALFTRYLTRTVGLDPERDMRIVAVGFGAARLASLRTNQVDVTVGAAPEADQVELEGFGALFIDCAQEVSLFREFPFSVALTTPEYANERPDLVRGIAQALGQANDLFATNFGQVVDVLKEQFPTVPPKALERALERDREIYPKGCRMSVAMWENVSKVAVELKMLPAALPTKEGEVWTNRFLI